MAADDRFMQAPIDIFTPEFGDLYDELPLWSAPFGQLLLELQNEFLDDFLHHRR